MTRTQPNPLLWSAILATAASFGSYFFACVFPFAAVATVAALTLSRGQAMGLVTAVWAVNQIVGFSFMHYPHTNETIALGIVIGVGALVATVVAGQVGRSAQLVSARSIATLGSAFLTYQVIQWFGAQKFGGAESFTLAINTGIAFNDLGWFLMLGGAYRLLSLNWQQGTVAKA